MNIFYYNESFNVHDGSSGHAFGLLNSFKNHENIEAIATFPVLDRERRDNNRAGIYTEGSGFSVAEQLLRFTKRTVLSGLRCRGLYKMLEDMTKSASTVQLARVGLFDTTPCLLSEKLRIPLVAEWNTPFYYEVGDLRNGSMMSLVKHWELKFLQRADLIYTVSNELNQILLDEYDLPASKLLAVPNGYDPDIYPRDKETFEKKRKAVRAKKGWIGKTVIAFIGSLKIWHGIKNLIKIAEVFSVRDEKIRFVVIGDGECRELMRDASHRLNNLEWMVSQPPFVMAEYLIACDLGIMPYVPIDNFYFSPLKLYDMIGAVLPSIGLSSGQINEVYRDYPEAGWGVEEGTPEEYIGLIEHLQCNKAEISAKKERLLTTRINHTWKERVDILIGSFMEIAESRKCLK